MATSSFDSTIKINKKSANSLIKILEEEIYEHVDLNTSIEVKKENKKMETRIRLRDWIERFKDAEFENGNTKVQMDAGWYDWFCRDTSLKNKTKKMGNIIKQIKDGGKVDLDNTYVWFKINCPMSGGLYDDFRIANISNGATQLLVQLDSPWENERYAVYSVDDFFDKPVLLTNSSRELVKWLNGEL